MCLKLVFLINNYPKCLIALEGYPLQKYKFITNNAPKHLTDLALRKNLFCEIKWNNFAFSPTLN